MAICAFCKAVKESLQDLCIKWPSPNHVHALSRQFERLKGIPFVVGAIDGSHLLIIAPTENVQDYYNRKGFHSILLQVIVSADCCIWNYDIGWVGNIHDWKLFEQNEARKSIKAGHLRNYCLVGDAAYPPWPWMLLPFKGHKDGLSRVEYHWNYIQSSTRMSMECTFGMLKSRFRILLKRNDTQLDKVPDIVAACLILHNLCVRYGDGFDNDWIDEAKSELQAAIESERKSKEYLERVKHLQIHDSEVVRAAAYGLHGVAGTRLNSMEALSRSLEQDPNEVASIIAKAPRCSAAIFVANFARRNALATALYDKSTRELIDQQFRTHSTESEDSGA